MQRRLKPLSPTILEQAGVKIALALKLEHANVRRMRYVHTIHDMCFMALLGTVRSVREKRNIGTNESQVPAFRPQI
jgi:hypothetical protein